MTRKQCTKTEKKSRIVGGCLLIGMGIGFIFIKDSIWYFLASLFAGLGTGLVLGSFPDGNDPE